MRHVYTCLFLMLLHSQVLPAQEEVSSRIILIGNAGTAVQQRSNFLDAVKSTVPLDKKTTVLYLGNNVSEPGNIDALKTEADLVSNTPAQAIFIPGYRDWANGRHEGYASVLEQQRFIKGLDKKNIKFYPGDGCPGPKDVDLGNDAEMIIFDSQWWLHEHEKPDIESGCKIRTIEDVRVEMEDIVEDKADKFLIFVSHHPFFNKGLHSGSFGLKQHLFPLTDITALQNFYLPLPVIGSLYPLTRNAVTTKQDMNNETYSRMMHDVTKYLSTHPYVLYVAGQERNLQLLNSEGQNYIVSGAAAKTTRVRHTREAGFAEQETGFAVVEILKNKQVRVKYYEVDEKGASLAFSNDVLNYSKFPPHAEDTARMPYVAADSFTTSANTNYGHTFGLNRLFAGNNNREIWSQPVKMKVFHINSEKGGLKITGLGGGHQSKSLQLEDKDGKKWVLRQTNKNLDEVMPEGLKETIARDVAQDMISASHPYGSLPVPRLMTALNMVHATPEVVFVPNDTALGEYRALFANTVCQLEEREPTLDNTESENTLDAVKEILDHHNYFKDQKAFLKARMVDILIADFDRHYAQWKWGVLDTGKGKFFYPVPKDRDQAMFYSDGLLIKLARRQNLGYMQNFSADIKRVTMSAFTGRDVDMFFLNELDENDWQQALTEFKAQISDEVIDEAVSNLPQEILSLQGAEIKSKLISRRDQIPDKGMEYYRFLSRKINVLGTNKDDIFTVAGENGGLWVKVYGRDKDGDTSLQYARWIDPQVTKEVRLYGFNGSDYFDMSEDTKSPVKFHVLGGKGKDTFNIRGGSRNLLYDLSYEDNQVLSKSRTAKMFSRDQEVNEFRFRESIHNSTTFPGIVLGANEDDGFLVGLGLTRTSFGFRDSTRHRLTTLFALSNQAYQVRYKGDFINLFRNWDMIAKAELVNPTLNYFFGYGNETVRDMSKPLEYYRTRYNFAATDILFRKRFVNRDVMSLAAGPSIFYYWNDPVRNDGRILETPSVVGLDSAGVNSQKLYGGGKLVFNIDNLYQQLWPKKGLEWTTELTLLQPLSTNARPFSKVQSDMTLYATLSHPSNLVAVIRAGGGHVLSDSFEYFQAFSLGAHNYLRGFRKNRFTGSSMFYSSAELRWKLFDFNAYVIRGGFGLVGFGETGRVWMKNENSDKWHTSYGGGAYITPFNMVVVSVVMAVSPEDRLLNASVGTKINLVFQGNN
jgi:hypothetical protein